MESQRVRIAFMFRNGSATPTLTMSWTASPRPPKLTRSIPSTKSPSRSPTTPWATGPRPAGPRGSAPAYGP